MGNLRLSSNNVKVRLGSIGISSFSSSSSSSSSSSTSYSSRLVSSLLLFSLICLSLLTSFTTDAKRSACWRYGHSCWGGHGKRSGVGVGGGHDPLSRTGSVLDSQDGDEGAGMSPPPRVTGLVEKSTGRVVPFLLVSQLLRRNNGGPQDKMMLNNNKPPPPPQLQQALSSSFKKNKATKKRTLYIDYNNGRESIISGGGDNDNGMTQRDDFLHPNKKQGLGDEAGESEGESPGLADTSIFMRNRKNWGFYEDSLTSTY